MGNISSEFIFPFLGALIGVVLVFAVVGLIYYAVKPSSRASDFTDQVDQIIAGEEGEYKEPSLIEKWVMFWGKELGRADFGKWEEDGTEAGRDMAIVAVATFLLGFAVTRNAIFAAALPAAILFGILTFARGSGNRKNKEMMVQLPGMLFALKSSLQAGNTSERALMEIVDSMPSPLYEDLAVARSILSANGTFKDALDAMSANTTSRDLKFLCACMIQASESGASMVTQIDNIQKVIESRQEVAAKIDTAVKSVAPAMYLSGLVIPAMFIFSFFMDAAAKSFWFQSLMAWVCFIAVVILYLIGLLLTKNQVDKVRNI